jgi:hypothetical protein
MEVLQNAGMYVFKKLVDVKGTIETYVESYCTKRNAYSLPVLKIEYFIQPEGKQYLLYWKQVYAPTHLPTTEEDWKNLAKETSIQGTIYCILHIFYHGKIQYWILSETSNIDDILSYLPKKRKKKLPILSLETENTDLTHHLHSFSHDNLSQFDWTYNHLYSFIQARKKFSLHSLHSSNSFTITNQDLNDEIKKGQDKLLDE